MAFIATGNFKYREKFNRLKLPEKIKFNFTLIQKRNVLDIIQYF